jgi:hypothetical protein
VNLWILGLRRSGTTILYDALGEDPQLRCFYEPLREQAETVGGGSGARDADLFAETRDLRERFRAERYPELGAELFNWGGPRTPELELEPDLPDHVADWLGSLLERGPEVAIKETRLHHKLAAIARLDPGGVVVHLLRDPRAVTASMLLGRRRRTNIYPDAEAFFTARTGRRLWSSRRISERLVQLGEPPGLPADLPDFLRPLLVWRAAFKATSEAGPRLFGERYVQVRLEDLRVDPAGQLARIYAPCGRPAPPPVTEWASAKIRAESPLHLGDDPRWARAARLLELNGPLRAAGYAEILELEAGDPQPLDLAAPPQRSRLAGLIGRARSRLAER